MLNKKKREIEILLDPYPVKMSSATIFRGPLAVKEWVPDKNIKKNFCRFQKHSVFIYLFINSHISFPLLYKVMYCVIM